MHRQILINTISLTVLVSWAHAYTWHDTIGWAQYGVSEVVNYANWAAQQANTAATELNTLHSYEQEVIQLVRLGNPAALAQLTGVNEITSLYRDYAMISSDLFQMKAAVDPQNFQSQFNSV